jgi:hypothetical protein
LTQYPALLGLELLVYERSGLMQGRQRFQLLDADAFVGGREQVGRCG